LAFRYKYAARLNSFRNGDWGGRKPSTLDLIARAATVPGLKAVDLNFPDHVHHHKTTEITSCLRDAGIELNGLAMRYYTEAGFKLGAFTHPDQGVRRLAIDITKRGIDALGELGGNLMTLWMGNDGYDYSFQADYGVQWEHTLEAMAEVADHNKNIDISIEYKPNEPRSFALMPDAATTLLAIREINRNNLGVTLDFAHVLYAGEMPAHAAQLVARYSRLLGVHLNDAYAKRDDGLMVAAVHPIQTLELLYVLHAASYKGVIYFDTFPDITGMDPVAECTTNINTVENLARIADGLRERKDLASAIASQNAPASLSIINGALYGSLRL
jgi:sugar phosphate isomerase/epimerase